ncbi:MAG: response regulator [Phycisphaerae bacterium]|nr:response regulator [Gemmatimonadaceae bacterium]
MSISAIISLCAAALQLGMGLLLVGLARAPGWRVARTFALIALTAAVYSFGDIFFALPTASDETVLWASRLNYCFGSLHGVAWLAYTFGGPTASPRRMPVAAKALAIFLTVVALFILLTGAHVIPGQWQDLRVDWASVQYHTPLVYEWAEWYALAILAAVAIPFAVFIPRTMRREPGALTHLIGFTIFFACMSVEVLVTNGVITTFYLGDIGFLAVVIPVVVATVRRVVSDAGTLDTLSRRLAGEVEERTVALDRAQDALMEAERHASLGRLAAGVGHEINNPLTYLALSLVELEGWAATRSLPPDVRDALTNAHDGTERIRRVVDGLRTYSRTHSGEHRVVSLETIARNALRVASHHVQHVARLDVDLQSTAPVLGDEPQLVQIVVNLITNSAQAIAEARLNRDVSITIRTYTLPDQRVVLEVGDTGPGIPPDDLKRLAEPYFTTRAHAGGTGLGLFLSRGIAERHRGNLEVESTVGSGTVARVTLPAANVASASAPTAPLPVAELQTTKTPTSQGESSLADDANAATRKRVLLIDDEPLLTRAMSRTLTPHCDVSIAESATRALEMLDANPSESAHFDVVLCDIMMPGMTGMEFADILSERDPALRRRTVFLTGGAVTEVAGAFLERSDVHYLIKPVKIDMLVRTIGETALL